jgi:hypothetical protein
MISPNAQALSKTLTTLTGLPVSCTRKPRFTPSRSRRVYGIYNELPAHDTILLRADLSLLASLGGCVAGLPDSLAADRAKISPLDETLRGGIHDVLNFLSTLLSGPERVVFRSLCLDVAYLTGPARSVLNSQAPAQTFEVTIPGYTGGELTIFSEES